MLSDIHVPHRKEPTEFGDPPTFPPVPLSGPYFYLFSTLVYVVVLESYPLICDLKVALFKPQPHQKGCTSWPITVPFNLPKSLLNDIWEDSC